MRRCGADSGYGCVPQKRRSAERSDGTSAPLAGLASNARRQTLYAWALSSEHSFRDLSLGRCLQLHAAAPAPAGAPGLVQ